MENEILSSVNQHFEDYDGIASYKSLSIAFGWSLEESQRNLGKYLRRHPHLHPVYCVSGFHTSPEGGWEYVVRLTKSVDNEADKDLINPTRYVYSLHRGKTTNSMALACFDKSLDQDPTVHPVLVSFPWQPCKCAVPDVKPQKASAGPSPAKQKLLKSSSTATAATTVAAPIQPAAPASKRLSIKRQMKSQMQSNLKFGTKKKSEPHKAPVEPESIPDPFADSEEDETYDDENLHTKRRRVVFSSDEKSVKEVLKNRGKIPPTSTSTKSLTTSRRHNKSPQKSKAAKSTTKDVEKGKRSKMKRDENGEEVDEDEEPFKLSLAKGVKPDRPSAADPSHNTRRRQVTKTFVDDDGFLVTEKIWENVEVNEDVAERPEPAIPSNSEPKAVPPPATKGVGSKPKKTRQATLISFFKKFVSCLSAKRRVDWSARSLRVA